MIRHYRVVRGVMPLALGVAVCSMIGCSSDDTSTDQPSHQAIETSSNSRAPAPQSGTATMAFPTGNRNSSQLLVEEIIPREARVGRPFTYQIRATNLTNQTLTSVVLRQKIPSSLALANQGPHAQQAAYANERQENGGQARFDIGDLGPRQSKTIEVTGTPSQQGPIDTCLSAQFNPPTLCAVVMAVAPSLKIQGYGQSEADICQDITDRFTVTNTGTGTARNVVVRENLPNGLETADGKMVAESSVGDLTQGQSKEVIVRLRAREAGRFATRAVATSDAGDVRSEEVATVVRAPRLAVTVQAPDQQYSGDQISYRVIVKNNGDAAAMDTKLRFGATPGMVQFIGAEGADGKHLASEREGGGQMLGTLAPGEAREVLVHFRTLQGGQVNVNATAEAKCATPVTTPLDSMIKTVSASALIVTHDHDPVPVGREVTYHIIVENKGQAPDHNVRVIATLPQNEQFIGVKGAMEGRADGNKIDLGTIPVLQPRQQMAWDVTAKAVQPGQVEMRVTMTSESTPNEALKIEPTKLIAGQGQLQERTNEAPAPTKSE